MSEILDAIAEKSHIRRERYTHIEELELPPPEWIAETCIVGTYSIVTFSTRRRFIHLPSAIPVNGVVETPPTIARDYLTIVYKKSPPAKHEQVNRLRHHLYPPPLLVRPGFSDEGWYLDVRRCYWSIMNAFGWNVDYFPGRWLAVGRPPNDFPFPDEVVARNSLVSSCRVSEFDLWTPEGEKRVSRGNHLLNYQLLGFIADALHSIASIAKKAGAVYIGTDGYVLTTVAALNTVSQAIADFGLSSAVKAHGKTDIRAPGDYRVGRKRTRVFSNQDTPYSNIREVPERKWLQKQISGLKLAAEGAPASA
jgi:hypothetical protein